MNLNHIIALTKIHKEDILNEYKIYEAFHRQNPWLIANELTDLEKELQTEVPGFNAILGFKEDYLVDDLKKVYNQLNKKFPNLNTSTAPDESVVIIAYSLVPGLAQEQIKEGLSIGDKDPVTGGYVTGSDIMIEMLGINVRDFMYSYSAVYN